MSCHIGVGKITHASIPKTSKLLLLLSSPMWRLLGLLLSERDVSFWLFLSVMSYLYWCAVSSVLVVRELPLTKSAPVSYLPGLLNLLRYLLKDALFWTNVSVDSSSV